METFVFLFFLPVGYLLGLVMNYYYYTYKSKLALSKLGSGEELPTIYGTVILHSVLVEKVGKDDD